jgi:cytidine deaminase
MEKEELVELAKQARKLSYSPYSHFAVGAVVECKDGSTYMGANIENSSYPLCMCAERNAIYNAMMHGQTRDDFVAMALTADTDGPCSPCGACRQVLSELYPSEAPIYMSNLNGAIQETTTGELLPFAFSEDDL